MPTPQRTADPGQRTDERTVPVTGDGDHDRYAHIIRKSDEMKGYVLGEEVVALCGKRWVPSRDPKRYPICPTCRDILTHLRDGAGGGEGEGAGSGSGDSQT